ncbi:hypothetical protein CDAR_535911 [Caerostris darwini]|uniref:Uncharacterized protein n=1 Tax=Caerostris darwini TaxID=1538125 RepID=A0AAV4QSV3_9ARAC|nr:hypothetical protein CDAR_535911 [Caerostris darwini]
MSEHPNHSSPPSLIVFTFSFPSPPPYTPALFRDETCTPLSHLSRARALMDALPLNCPRGPNTTMRNINRCSLFRLSLSSEQEHPLF